MCLYGRRRKIVMSQNLIIKRYEWDIDMQNTSERIYEFSNHYSFREVNEE